MTVLRNRFGVAVFVSLAVLAGCGGSGKGAASAVDESGKGSEAAEVGKRAPDLSIQSLNGKGKISLESLEGKLVLVDFWATWCAPCKQSFPKLEELSKKMGDNVEIVGISVDDEKNGIAEFAKENGATFAIGWDEGHEIAGRWKVEKMPTTFIVDKTGKVRFVHGGYHDGETKEMEKELATLMDEASSDTRVAKNDVVAKEKEEPAADAKSDVKDESKSDAASAGSEDEKSEAAATAAKKKSSKKAARAGAKTTAPKKQAKKKKK